MKSRADRAMRATALYAFPHARKRAGLSRCMPHGLRRRGHPGTVPRDLPGGMQTGERHPNVWKPGMYQAIHGKASLTPRSTLDRAITEQTGGHRLQVRDDVWTSVRTARGALPRITTTEPVSYHGGSGMSGDGGSAFACGDKLTAQETLLIAYRGRESREGNLRAGHG